MNPAEIVYRRTAAAAGGNGLGLLIALYDTLAGDLRRAAEAERSNDIEKRCREVNHALLVIGCLQDWVARGSGGELGEELSAFYTSMRRRLIEAQVRRSAPLLEEQMALVLEVRESWQAVESAPAPSAPEILPPVQTRVSAPSSAVEKEHKHLSWSA